MAGLDCSMLWWAGWLAPFREGSSFEAGKIDARFRVLISERKQPRVVVGWTSTSNGHAEQ